MLLRLLSLTGLLLIGLRADTLTDTFSSYIDYVGCTSFDCSYTYSIPQFNPSLGTLYEIDWRLEEGESVGVDPDLCPAPAQPVPYSYSLTVADAFLNGDGSVSASASGLNYGGCAGGDTIGFRTLLTFGNTISDVAAYIGTGDVAASTDPIIMGDNLPGATYFIDWQSELTLTYDYTPPSSVPEPRSYVFVLICLMLPVAYTKRTRHRKST